MCRGLGRVYFPTDNPRVARSGWCPHCGGLHAARELQSLVPMPDKWAGISFADVRRDVAGEHAMIKQAECYAAEPRGWFCVVGGSGNAKTLTLAALRNALIARGLGVLYLTGPDLVQLYFRALNQDDNLHLERLYDRLCAADALMVDELDKFKWHNDYCFEQGYRLLNWRYEHEALTCLALNDERRIPDAVLSRMRDGRWSPDGQGDGLIRNRAPDQRPYNASLWTGAQPLRDPRTREVIE